MPTVYSIFGPKPQFEDLSGNPMSGGKVYFRVGGTSTPKDTYTTSAGTVLNANPVVLNARGEPANEIWGTTGPYRIILEDSLGNTIWTVDNFTPINDVTSTTSEWQASGLTPSFINATSFSVPGDQTSTLQPRRRIRTQNTGGTIYSTILSSVFSLGVTTVTTVNDTGVLDSGLSAVSYGFLSATNPSQPLESDATFKVAKSSALSILATLSLAALTASRVYSFPDYNARIGNIPAGVVMDYAGPSVPTGWLECDGAAVSRVTYAALFTAISTTWGAGDGSTTFNLPDFRGRTRIGRGTGTATAAGSNADVDTTNDTLTVATNTDKWVTGMAVLFTLSSGTITGLTSGVTYYIVRNNTTTVKLASSLANAQNGTVIDMTAKSSPVWTITHTFTARTLADQGGEEAHAISSTEELAHSHFNRGQGSTGSGVLITLQSTASGPANNVATDSTASFGGNAAMNNMPPYAATMTIISY